MTTKKKSFKIFAKITHKGRFKGEELKGGNESKGKGKVKKEKKITETSEDCNQMDLVPLCELQSFSFVLWDL